jgi:hypothetical protein
VKRGGSWNNNANNCTVSNRNNNNATNSNNNIGFRLVSILLYKNLFCKHGRSEKGKSRFLSCSQVGTKRKWLHGSVARSKGREALFFLIKGSGSSLDMDVRTKDPEQSTDIFLIRVL